MDTDGLAQVADGLPDAVLVIDGSGQLLWGNRSAERLFGMTATEMVGSDVFTFVHPEDRELVTVSRMTVEEKLVGTPIELRVRTASGWRLVELVGTSLMREPAVAALVVSLRDLTERRRWEVATHDGERFRSLVHNASSVLMLLDRDGTVESVSAAITRLLGQDQELVEGRPLDDVIAEHDHARFRRALHDALHRNPAAGPVSVELDFDRRDGPGTVPFELSIVNLMDEPTVAGLVVSAHDISQLRSARAALERMTVRDGLTGVANRALVLDRLEQMLERGRRSGVEGAALFVDLDRFKHVNDTFGHRVGDDLLRRTARRFEAALGPSASIGRHGGDEFVVLVDGPDAGAAAVATAERLLRSLDAPFVVRNAVRSSVTVSATIGLVVGSYPSAEEMLFDADIALNEAKARGRNHVVRFEPSMRGAFQDRIDMEQSLSRALDAGQLFLVYQPVLELADGTVGGVEALLRWRHPERGVIAPADFIPTLEESGMIVDVGAFVLDQACRQVRMWHGLGHPVALSVNVSPQQFDTDRLIADVNNALDNSGLQPGSLILDVTDTTLMRDASLTMERVGALHDRGVRIAIDRFGTGSSSLSCLQQLPVDVLKIDRSFVAGIDATAAGAALVRAVVDLGTALGLDTVAQGIEHATQLERLRHEGCPKGQGFLFSPPMPAAEAERFLATPVDEGTPWWWPVERVNA